MHASRLEHKLEFLYMHLYLSIRQAAFRQYKSSKLFVLRSTWILSLDKISCISV